MCLLCDFVHVLVVVGAWEEVGCQRKLVANGIISVGMDLSY